MPFNPDLHHRRSIRLKDWNYTSPGSYFMTICAQDRACLFGDITGALITLNDAGRMVDRWWRKLTANFGVELAEHVIMPNHLHGIIAIKPAIEGSTHASTGQTPGSAPTASALGEMVQWVKTMSTNEYLHRVKTNGWPPFNKRLWQRNYYEHIIRDEEDSLRIRQYIIDNPARWLEDELFSTL
jgi:REP-associated tyrosine transposase